MVLGGGVVSHGRGTPVSGGGGRFHRRTVDSWSRFPSEKRWDSDTPSTFEPLVPGLVTGV